MHTQPLHSAIPARSSELPVHDQFIHRWSPRAFTQARVPLKDLFTMFEAARWAPSAYNVQPWRFIYALRDTQAWQQFLNLLDPFNASWAKDAGALIILVSDTTMPGTEPAKPFPSHSFDAGAAWAHIALQAWHLGFHAHAMAGIEFEKIRRELTVPDRFKIEIAIAIGKIGEPNLLPRDLQEREKPSNRLPLERIVSSGHFQEEQSQ